MFSKITCKNLNSSVNALELVPVTFFSACNLYYRSSVHMEKYLDNQKNIIQTMGNVSYDVLEFLTVKNIATLVAQLHHSLLGIYLSLE